MALKLNTDFIGSSVDLSENGEIAKIAHIAEAAHKKVLDRTGAGSDFLGWVDLPVNYDREEFEADDLRWAARRASAPPLDAAR